MESETLSPHAAETSEKSVDNPEDSGTEEEMAPPESGGATIRDKQNGQYGMDQYGGSFVAEDFDNHRMMSADDSENAEDGEILEDGEIASDEGEQADDGEVPDDDARSSSSPSKRSHKEERERHGRNKRERHSKRRRSKEDGHRDKQQKKKRHREYVDFDKAGEDAEQQWESNDRRDKGDRKGDRSPPVPYHSPSHDSHGEERSKHDKDGGDKHRRGSGDNRHHGSGRDRGR